MFEVINLQKITHGLIIWFHDYFWTRNTLYQGIIIGAAFMIGAIFDSFISQRLTDSIEKSQIPIRIKRTLNNLRRLVFPLATLVAMFVGSVVASSDTMQMHVFLLIATMKVLLAWIVIRAALQVINNALIRSFFAVTIWSMTALSIFGIFDETTATLDAIGVNIGSFRLSALAIIKSGLAIFILLYIAMFISTFAERRVLRSKSLTRSTQVLMAKIIRVTLITCALVIAVTSAGIDLSIFAVFSGAVGLGIGFGLQRVVSNLFSGMLLLIDRSIEPGDVIEIQDSGTFGWVNHMAARYTEIVTRDNKSYLIPNEDFITQRVIN